MAQIPNLGIPQVNVPHRGAAVRAPSRQSSSREAKIHLPRSPLKPININSISLHGAVSIAGQAAGGFIRYRNEKAEIARRAEVLEQETLIHSYFNKTREDLKAFKLGDAAGMPGRIRGIKSELFEKLVPADSDDKTRNDLTRLVNADYNSLLSWGHTYEVSQFDLADKVAIEGIGNRLDVAAAKIPPGSDLRSIHDVVLKAMDQYEKLHNDLSPEQLELIRESMLNRATSVMLQSWMVDAPAKAETYFNENKETLQTIMGADFARIARQMDGISDSAREDRAIGVALKQMGNNRVRAAALFRDLEWLEDNMKDLSTGEVDYSAANHISNTLAAQGEYTNRVTARAVALEVDKSIEKIVKEKMNADGTVNWPGVITGLTRLHRIGEIPSEVYREALTNFSKLEFSNDDMHALYADIDSGKVEHHYQIIAQMKGDEDPMKYVQYFDKVKKANKIQPDVDYLKEGMSYWDGMAVSKQGKKGTFKLEPQDRPLFKRDLRNRMLAEGLTFRDPKVLDIAVEILVPSGKSGETVTPTEGGKFPWDLPGGADYGRYWKQVLEVNSEQEQRNRGEGVITPVTTEMSTDTIDSSSFINAATTGGVVDMDQAVTDLLNSIGADPTNLDNIALAKAKIEDDMRIAQEAVPATAAAATIPATAAAATTPAEQKQGARLNPSQRKLIKEALDKGDITADQRKQLLEMLLKADILEATEFEEMMSE